MTFAELRDELLGLRDGWADKSNATELQEELDGYSEQFIADMDDLLYRATGNHPDPPPPRIKP